MTDIDRLFATFDGDLGATDEGEFPRSTLGSALARALDDQLRREPLDTADVVLDMGCGSGLQAFTMLNAGAHRVDAMDINARAVNLAAARLSRFASRPGFHDRL